MFISPEAIYIPPRSRACLKLTVFVFPETRWKILMTHLHRRGSSIKMLSSPIQLNALQSFTRKKQVMIHGGCDISWNHLFVYLFYIFICGL